MKKIWDFFRKYTAEAKYRVDSVLESSWTEAYTQVLCSESPCISLSASSCKRSILFKVSSFFLILFSASIFGKTLDQDLQEKLDKIKTMRANFFQVIVAKNVEPVKSSGNMALSKPGLFYWKTSKPTPQLFIADGDKIWIYDAELEQVSVKKQGKNLSGAAAIFLSDKNNNIAKNFDVDVTKRGDKESYNLRAKSNNPNFVKIGLVFVGDIIKKIDLFDELGQHTELVFTNVQLNSNLSPKLFKFVVPKGTDVVRQ